MKLKFKHLTHTCKDRLIESLIRVYILYTVCLFYSISILYPVLYLSSFDLLSLLVLLRCYNSPISQSECILLLKADDTNVCKLNRQSPAHTELFINLNQWNDTSRLPSSADSNQARWPITGSLCKRLKMTTSQYSYASLEAGPQENTLHAAPNGNQLSTKTLPAK